MTDFSARLERAGGAAHARAVCQVRSQISLLAAWARRQIED